VLQFKLGCQIQGMIIGGCGEMAFFEEGLDRRSNGRGEFVKHLHPSGAASRGRNSPCDEMAFLEEGLDRRYAQEWFRLDCVFIRACWGIGIFETTRNIVASAD
jgi:hypothetical protein